MTVRVRRTFTPAIVTLTAMVWGLLLPDAVAGPLSPVVGALVEPELLRGIEDVHLEGDVAYLPCREGRRLTLCSVADPTNPTILSTFTHESLGPVAGFVRNGDTLYLVSQSNSCLLVVDGHDKSALRLVGATAVGNGVLYKVAYRDGYCYVAGQSEQRLYVVDVRDSTRPAVVGSVPVGREKDGPFSVLLRGDHALVGTIFGSVNRLAAVNIADPQSPRLVHELLDPVMGHVSGDATGNLLYAVNWDVSAFFILDITDAARPELVATLVDRRLGKPNRCVVRDDRAYLPMVEGHGVAVVDISQPTRPAFLTTFTDPRLKKTYGAAIHGDYLVVGAREGNCLMVLDRKLLETATP